MTEIPMETRSYQGVSSTGKQLYEQPGATGVPVILVGKQRMNGFTEAGFERLIR